MPALVAAFASGGPFAFATQLVRSDPLWDLAFRRNRIDVYRGRRRSRTHRGIYGFRSISSWRARPRRRSSTATAVPRRAREGPYCAGADRSSARQTRPRPFAMQLLPGSTSFGRRAMRAGPEIPRAPVSIPIPLPWPSTQRCEISPSHQRLPNGIHQTAPQRTPILPVKGEFCALGRRLVATCRPGHPSCFQLDWDATVFRAGFDGLGLPAMEQMARSHRGQPGDRLWSIVTRLECA
jgi:hypothetical protein